MSDLFEQAKQNITDSVIYKGSPQLDRGFDQFKAEAKLRNLEAIQCSPIHWQLRGGVYLVNYYPTTKKVYIAGSKDGTHGGFEKAFRAAFRPPLRHRGDRISRKPTYREDKKVLLARNPHCMHCGRHLTSRIATIEHIVPISRGGADHPNNWGLACLECNLQADENLKGLDHYQGKLKACRGCGHGIPMKKSKDFCLNCIDGMNDLVDSEE